jgi:hypothetical protein
MNTNLAAMNELDCYFVWTEATTGYADPNANKLGHLQSLAQFITPSISNVADMNSLACLRSIVVGALSPRDTSGMDELACLRIIYSEGYSFGDDTNSARWNMLACLRGIVNLI